MRFVVPNSSSWSGWSLRSSTGEVVIQLCCHCQLGELQVHLPSSTCCWCHCSLHPPLIHLSRVQAVYTLCFVNGPHCMFGAPVVLTIFVCLDGTQVTWLLLFPIHPCIAIMVFFSWGLRLVCAEYEFILILIQRFAFSWSEQRLVFILGKVH